MGAAAGGLLRMLRRSQVGKGSQEPQSMTPLNGPVYTSSRTVSTGHALGGPGLLVEPFPMR
jgi:hypothetical protein